jgi:hypothetical protein
MEASAPSILALATTFKALGDESRLQIVGLLARRPHYAEELADLLELAPPTISHHLRVLAHAGLVRRRKDPPYIRCSLDLARVRSLAQELGDVRLLAERLELPGEESASARILRELLDEDGRLKTVPVRKRPLAVLLRWLAQRFQSGHIYPEREVNRILMEVYDDVPLLRQLLLEHGWMQREGGVFRRIEEVEAL